VTAGADDHAGDEHEADAVARASARASREENKSAPDTASGTDPAKTMNGSRKLSN